MDECIDLFKHYDIPEIPYHEYYRIKKDQKQRVRKIKGKIRKENLIFHMSFIFLFHILLSNYGKRHYLHN